MLRTILVGIAMVTGVSGPALANSDQTSGTASALIALPLQITKTQDLAFGQIIPTGAGPAQVTISAQTGSRVATANANLQGTVGDRATFTVSGQPSTSFQILVAGPIIFLSGPGLTITIDNLRVSANAGAEQLFASTHVIPASGTLTLGVGGRLNASATQTAGNYSGDFQLTAVHQ